MSDTQQNQPCLNLERTGIKPDVRVAYTDGLVLGVDEFVQEQHYLLEKDYLHNRGLHGYGTVYGLALSIAKSEGGDAETGRSVDFGATEKVWIRVSAGVGVDQRGRTFVLHETFCINLTDWWQDPKNNVPTNEEEGQSTPPIYIRARFDERCGDPATLAGQPCSTDAVTSADSRIYDSVILELSLVKPVMTSWDLAQRFAWLIAQIRIERGIERDPHAEQLLLNYVRQWLADDTYQTKFEEMIADLDPPYFQLPEGTPETQQTLDALRLAYLTDVVPKGYRSVDPYDKPLNEPENDVLLGEIDLELTSGANDTSGYIEKVTLNEDERPYLLGTQTFQELLTIGQRDKNRRRLFASLHVQNSKSLLLWVHPDIPLAANLGMDAVTLTRNDDATPLNVTISSQGQGTGIFTLVPDVAIPSGAQVKMVFNLNNLRNQQGAALDLSAFNDYLGLNEAGDKIAIYAFADNLPSVRSLADIRTQRTTGTRQITLDIGFNLAGTISFTPGGCQILKAGPAVSSAITVTPRPDNSRIPRLWHVTLPTEVTENNVIIVRFDTQNVQVDGTPLSQLMNEGLYSFSGYDGAQYIDLPYIVSLPAQVSSEDINRIVDVRVEADIPGYLDRLRTLPFATITPITNSDGMVTFEIWMHSSLVASAWAGPIRFDKGEKEVLLGLAVYAEKDDTVTLVDFSPAASDPVPPNVLTITLTSQDVDLNYLRFVFFPKAIHLGDQNLQDFIEANNIRFDGYYVSSDSGDGAIVIYVRNPLGNIGSKRVGAIVGAVATPLEGAVAPTPKSRATSKARGKG